MDVSQIVLTGDGDGDWAAWLDAADGVQIWLDNGDGQFDAASDTLLYSSGGSGRDHGGLSRLPAHSQRRQC
jgi:hypothetical protein